MLSVSHEIWKPVPSIKGLLVSDHGRVRYPSSSVVRSDGVTVNYLSRIASVTPGGNGYLKVEKNSRCHYIHRLVLEAFIGPCPASMECLHADDNPTNNRLWNLSWGTHKKNCETKDHRRYKLTPDDVREIRRLYADTGASQEELGRQFGVTQVSIGRIVRRMSWKKVM